MTHALGTLRSAAREALLRGDTARASEIAAHILRELPRDVRTILLYGEAALEHGELALADCAFTAFLSAEPGDPVALAGLALVAEQRGHLEEALDLYGRALECSPSLLQLRQQVERVSAVLACPVPDWRSPLARGVSLLQDGRAYEARQLLREVTAEAPERPEAWLALMAACRALGDADGAEEAARAALERAPNAIRALHLVAERALAKGDELIAGRLFVEIWQLDPQGDLARDSLAAPRSAPILGPLPPSCGEFVELRISLAPAWPLQLRRQPASAPPTAPIEPVETAAATPPPTAPATSVPPPAPAPMASAPSVPAPAPSSCDRRESRGLLRWLRVLRRKPATPPSPPEPVPLSQLVFGENQASEPPAVTSPTREPARPGNGSVPPERVLRAAQALASALPEPGAPVPAPAQPAAAAPLTAPAPRAEEPRSVRPEPVPPAPAAEPAPLAPQLKAERHRSEPREFLRDLLAVPSPEGAEDMHVRLLASYFLELPALDPEHFEQALRHQASGARGPAMAAAGAEILRRWQEQRAPSDVAS